MKFFLQTKKATPVRGTYSLMG